MVDRNLNKVTGEMCPAAQQDVEDLLSNKLTPTERPIQSLHGSVSREEVVSPDVRVLRKRVEAFAHDYE